MGMGWASGLSRGVGERLGERLRGERIGESGGEVLGEVRGGGEVAPWDVRSRGVGDHVRGVGGVRANGLEQTSRRSRRGDLRGGDLGGDNLEGDNL